MASAVRELRVFMASPSDLNVERGAVRDVAERLNAQVDELGVRVRVVGWEQVGPEAGRPQSLINQHVSDCDIFVALLGQRWGSGTGTYSSGFEEEFELALSRRTKGDAPAIGLFFAELSADVLADPGKQLKKVLGFRDRVRKERIALYKSFRNVDHLAHEVSDFLMPRLLELAGMVGGRDRALETYPTPTGSSLTSRKKGGRESEGRARDIESMEANKPDAVDTDGMRVPDDAQVQIAGALRQFATWFDGPRHPDAKRPDSDRMTLVGAAFAKDDGVLGVHHVHRLYKKRDELVLTLGEAIIWCRTYFAGIGYAKRDDRVIPIWGIFDRPEGIRWIFEYLATLVTGADIAVARGTLQFATERLIRIDGLWPSGCTYATEARMGRAEVAEDPSKRETDSCDPVARWLALFGRFQGVGIALNYMASVATPKDLPLLEALVVADGLEQSSREAVGALMASLTGDPRALAQLVPPKYATDVDVIVEQIVDATPNLDSEILGSMIARGHRRVAIAAAIQLVRTCSLDQAQVKAAADLHAPDVEAAMVERAAQDLDWGLELVKILRESNEFLWGALIARLLAASCQPGALKAMHETEQIGVVAWEALTIQNPELHIDEARMILDDEDSFVGERSRLIPAEHGIVAQGIIDDAKRASCTTLAKGSEVTIEDVRRVVVELDRDSFVTRSAALEALMEMLSGVAEDVALSSEDLSNLDNYWVTDYVDEVLASLLAPQVVLLWRDSDISTLRVAARIWELSQLSISDDELEDALYFEDNDLRMFAVHQLMARWSDEEVEQLLGRYGDRGISFWYNIIAVMDDRLYGYKSSIDVGGQLASAEI